MNQWTGYPPLPMSRRPMVSYICAWIPLTSMRPSAVITTRCPPWRKLLTEFAHSRFFTKLDAHHGYWSIILDQDSSLLTTFNSPFQKILFPATSLWPGLFPRHLPEKKWIRSLKNAKDALELQMTSPYTAAPRWNMMPTYEIIMHIAHKYDLVFNPQKTHIKAQAINFFGCLYNANGVHPDPGKVNAVHALPATHQCH